MNKIEPPSPPRRALGRGLEALLPSAPVKLPTAVAPVAAAPAPSADGVSFIALDQIQPNPYQPRRHFDPEALAELADSIRSQGVLQPVLVRPNPSGRGFQLIAGERRFRAAQIAAIPAVPALIRAFSDERSLEVALIENLQRSDLNPIEEAEAYAQLGQQFHLTQEAIAERTGKDRVTIANMIRLLRLDDEVRQLLRSGRLTPGQARPLIGLEPPLQRSLAHEIVAHGWTARRVEEHIAKLESTNAGKSKAKKPRDPNEREAETQLARALGTRVVLKAGRKGAGVVEIYYSNLEDFQRLYERLVPLPV